MKGGQNKLWRSRWDSPTDLRHFSGSHASSQAFEPRWIRTLDLEIFADRDLVIAITNFQCEKKSPCLDCPGSRGLVSRADSEPFRPYHTGSLLARPFDLLRPIRERRPGLPRHIRVWERNDRLCASAPSDTYLSQLEVRPNGGPSTGRRSRSRRGRDCWR